ncbi:MAG: endonuclease/exonuclease/phosphatase family protein [Planctomycetota bacterium]
MRPHRAIETCHVYRLAGGRVTRPTDGRLRVLTCNLGHGRGWNLAQFAVTGAGARRHLTLLAALLRYHRPHLVALQEADGPCWWSGRFDHVAWLARSAGYPVALRCAQVERRRLNYGVAVLSRLPLREEQGWRFVPVRRAAKGFLDTVAIAPWGETGVSCVHLDFASGRERRRQLAAMLAHLDGARPRIVLGDFNCGRCHADGPLGRLARTAGLHGWSVRARGPFSHPLTRQHLDWIMVGGGLQMTQHRVLPTPVSDHRAVLAEVAFTGV